MPIDFLAGKTIKSVEMQACNVWYVKCTDGSVIVIETVPIGQVEDFTLHGLQMRLGQPPFSCRKCGDTGEIVACGWCENGTNHSHCDDTYIKKCDCKGAKHK